MSVYTRYICVHPNSQIHREHIPLTSGVSCPYPSILGGHLKASMVITACFSSPRIISLTAECHPLTSVYWVWRGPNRTLILKWCVPWGTITNLPEDYWSSCSLKLPPAYLSCTIFSPSGLSAVKTWRVLFFLINLHINLNSHVHKILCTEPWYHSWVANRQWTACLPTIHEALWWTHPQLHSKFKASLGYMRY